MTTKKTKKNTPNKSKKSNTTPNINLHKQLRASSYSSSLSNIRKNLPKKKQRAFSHVIHAKGMDSSHDLFAHIIARPYGIIAGGVLAFFGVCLGGYYAEHYGYNFNYLLLFLLFIIGYLLEFLIETIIKFFISYKS